MESQIPLALRQYGLGCILILYSFSLFGNISTATYNITLGILSIFLFAVYFKKYIMHRKYIFRRDGFVALYLIFVVSLIFAAIGLGQEASIKYTFNYILFSLPLWVLFFLLTLDSRYVTFIQIGILIAGLYYLIQVVLLGNLVFAERVSVSFSAANRFAMALEIILPFFSLSLYHFSKFRRKHPAYFITFMILLIATLGLFVALLATQSRGGIAACGVGFLAVLLLWIFQNKYSFRLVKKLFLFFTILIVFAVGSIFITLHVAHRPYDQERLLLLQSTFHMWENHKLFGIGMGNWQKEYQQHYILPQAKEPTLPFPHNNTASFFSMSGTVGGIGYLIFSLGSMVFLIKKIDERPDNYYVYAMLWVCVAIFSHGMVDNTLYNKDITRMFYGMWGITMASLYLPLVKK